MPDPQPPRPAVVPTPGAGAEPAEVLRSVHLEMVDAVLSGDGLARVAELAGARGRRPRGHRRAAPRRRLLWPAAPEQEELLAELERYVADRVRDRPAERPALLREEIPIASGDELIGAVVRLRHGRGARRSAGASSSSCTWRRWPR